MTADLDVRIRAALNARRGEWLGLAQECGVSYSWVSKFVRGEISNPGYATLKRLSAKLLGEDAMTEVIE